MLRFTTAIICVYALLLQPSLSMGQSILRRVPISAAAAAASIGSVDVYMDCNTSSPGTSLTTTILDNCTQGLSNFSAGWSLTASHGMTIEAHQSSCVMQADVSVMGTTYPTSSTTKSLRYDHANNFKYASNTFGSDYRTMTVAGCLISGVASVAAGSATLFDFVVIRGSVSGQFVALQLNNGNCDGGGTYGMNIETNPGGVTTHSSCITISPNTAYWYSLTANYVSGTASLYIYNTSGTLVGSVTSSQTTGESIGGIRFGNNEIGTSSGNYSYFENWTISFKGQAPVPVGPATNNGPAIYHMQSVTGNGSASSTTIATSAMNLQSGKTVVVFVSTESSGNTVSSVTDTAGNTYTSDASCKVTGSSRGEMWYAKNTTANASNVITATFSGSSVWRRIWAVQLAGASTSAPFDVCATGTATAAADVTTASFTPSTSTGTVIMGAYIEDAVIFQPGTNYIQILSDLNSGGIQMRGSAPNSSQTATYIQSNTANKIAVAMALKQ